MSAPNHARHADDCGAYLLDTLSDSERRDFEAHLSACPECRRHVDLLRPAADALPRSVTPLAPPPALKRSLMEVVDKEAAERSGPAARRPLLGRLRALGSALGGPGRTLAWVGAALLLALAVAGGVAIGRLGSGDEADKIVRASVDRARLPSTGATLVLPAGGREGAILRMQRLPGLEPARVYQVWIKRGSEVIPLSTFLPGKDGSAAAAVPGSVRGAQAVMVTRERRGGASTPTETPVLSVRI